MMAKDYLIKLKGYVGGYDFDADYVDYKLSQNKGKDVDVLIDSLGGAVSTALSVARCFKDHGGVTVHFAGMNASAATIASMGAKKILIDKNGMYLVHKVSSFVFEFASLNADQLKEHIQSLEKTKRDLEKIDINIASMYADRCRKSKEDLLALMKTGGWLTAEEALQWGFVDGIEDVEGAEKPAMTGEIAAYFAASGIPVPPQMAKKSLFERVSAKIAELFNDYSHSTDGNIMEKVFAKIGGLLKVEKFTADDKGNFTLTGGQMQAIEDGIKQKDGRIGELEAQIAEKDNEIEGLKKQPGDTTTAVTDDGKAKGRQDGIDADLEEYRSRMAAANELYDAIQ